MNLAFPDLVAARRLEKFSGSRPVEFWKWFVRTGWLLYLLFLLALYSLGLPLVYQQRLQPCDGSTCLPWQVTALDAHTLDTVGLSLAFYAAYATTLPLLIPLAGLTVASLVAWNWAAKDKIALLTVLIIGTCAAFLPEVMRALTSAYPALTWPIRALSFVHIAGILPWSCLFPDGRWVPRWGRWLVLPSLGLGLLILWPANDLNAAIVDLLWPVLISASLGLLYYRYRWFAGPAQKQQIRWILYGTAVTVLTQVSVFSLGLLFPSLSRPGTLPNLAAGTIVVLSVIFLMVCTGLAVLRNRLFEHDFIINRALVYGALTAIITGLYGLVVGSLSVFLHSQGSWLISLIAVALVAIVCGPLRDRLQRAANRLMYGDRDEPYQVISRLGQRLEAAFEPWAALPTIVETVAQALKLPYVGIVLNDNHRPAGPDDWSAASAPPTPAGRSVTVAEYGPPQPSTLAFPLIYANEPLGELRVAPRAPGEALSAADQRLLADLARQAGVAVHAIRLAADLERTRLRMVSARRETRRRLGNDLHDGVGHHLASLLRKTELALSLLEKDAAAARAKIDEVRQGTHAAMGTVRNLAHTLHPPELELLGLTGALSERAAQIDGLEGLRVLFEAPASLPPLSVATEAAAYYIALEALSNVQRHARASHCTLRLALSTRPVVCAASPLILLGAPILEIEVKDDGRGLPPGDQRGLGVASMRERAVEVGGMCLIETRAESGVRVLARLPCLEVGPADR